MPTAKLATNKRVEGWLDGQPSPQVNTESATKPNSNNAIGIDAHKNR